jgi:hypothetical protein
LADQEDHGRPVHGEESVIDLRRKKMVVRLGQLDANGHRLRSADEQEDDAVHRIQEAELFMVDRNDPRVQRFEERTLAHGRWRKVQCALYGKCAVCHLGLLFAIHG